MVIAVTMYEEFRPVRYVDPTNSFVSKVRAVESSARQDHVHLGMK